MRRHLFTLVSAVSLLLCAAVIMMWARSYRVVDVVGRDGAESPGGWQRGGFVSSGVGVISVQWWLRQNDARGTRGPPVSGWGHEAWAVRPGAPPAAGPPWHGFTYEAAGSDSARPASDGRPVPKRMTYSHAVTVPHWFVLLLAIAPPALWLRRATRRRQANARLRQNRCPACGYDLRASPERCPECGAVAPSAPTT